MENKSYIVYVKVNDGYITAVNSSEFLTDTTEWVEIDRGYGDKYHHAQGNYFNKPIFTEGGAYRYKLIEDEVVECAVEEIISQENKLKSIIKPTPQEDTDAMLVDHEYRLTMLELFSDMTI